MKTFKFVTVTTLFNNPHHCCKVQSKPTIQWKYCRSL